MPSSLGSTGLVLSSQTELVQFYTRAFQTIYGADVNLGPETPDGQMLMVFVQSVLDMQDLLMQIYNGFDPDNAIGVVLDQRVAINGIQREGGTFTTTDVTLVLSQSVNLYGLDQSIQPVYTVSDSAGNQWELQTTQLGIGPGSAVLLFQAGSPGAITTIPNTITTPVTIVLGVSSINNPTTFATLGQNEESDAALKIRRQMSVALPSQGYFAGLLAALKNIPGIVFAEIVENDTNSTDSNGVPGHSIWVIVSGSGSPSAIAQAIYNGRSAGCGIFQSMDSGMQSFTITQADGSLFVVYWDDVIAQNLYTKFTASSLNGTTPPNIGAIRGSLPTVFVPGVGAQVNINELSTLVQDIDPNTLVTNAGFSTSPTGPFTNTLSPTTKNRQFAVSSPNVIILPMQLLPATSSVPHGTSEQFTGFGGFGMYTYSISVNNSGGSINSSSGLYTAGSSFGVTDTILVTDGQSNTATASVNVT